MKVLLLGGTAESRAIAAACPVGVDLVESWAGRTGGCGPAGGGRVGGFGGADGLADYLRAERIAAVVDATHPFAARMSRHAADACARLGIPLLRVARPGWGDRPDAADWRWVDDHDAACAAAAASGRALLTVGRQPLPHYHPLPDAVARVVAPPADAPPEWRIVVARGPFDLAAERDLLVGEGIGVLVTKDSGGPAAKLDAARGLGVPVIVVRRPADPEGVPTVADAAGAVAWLADR